MGFVLNPCVAWSAIIQIKAKHCIYMEFKNPCQYETSPKTWLVTLLRFLILGDIMKPRAWMLSKDVQVLWDVLKIPHAPGVYTNVTQCANISMIAQKSTSIWSVGKWLNNLYNLMFFGEFGALLSASWRNNVKIGLKRTFLSCSRHFFGIDPETKTNS